MAGPQATTAPALTHTRRPSPCCIVLFHHMDGGNYPAIISAIGTEPPYACNLTVFRPRRIEWLWAVEGEVEGQWSWPPVV